MKDERTPRHIYVLWAIGVVLGGFGIVANMRGSSAVWLTALLLELPIVAYVLWRMRSRDHG